jgi:hypothetical protein
MVLLDAQDAKIRHENAHILFLLIIWNSSPSMFPLRLSVNSMSTSRLLDQQRFLVMRFPVRELHYQHHIFWARYPSAKEAGSFSEFTGKSGPKGRMRGSA